MEFVEELFPEPPLSEFKSILAPLVQIDLSKWNVDMYYEAIGLDLNEELVENENDDLN